MNVLFIGNSFTARNDLPDMIAKMAVACGHSMEHQLIWAGGASLRMHWNKGEAAGAIRDGHWDYVVLQEQSTLPIKNAARMHENIRLFDGVIRESGARAVLYMTWARLHAPETQQAITDAYQSIGDELGAIVIPVGIAWQWFLAQHDKPALHDPDQSHPSLAGSYLAACVFLQSLFGESPVDNPIRPNGINPNEAALIQSVAAEMSNLSTIPDSQGSR